MKTAFSITADFMALLNSEAASRGVTVSQIVRESIADRYGVASRERKTKPDYSVSAAPKGVVLA